VIREPRSVGPTFLRRLPRSLSLPNALKVSCAAQAIEETPTRQSASASPLRYASRREEI
jgi:hypothetical protein